MQVKNKQDAIDYCVSTASTISERIQGSSYLTKLTDMFCILATSLADNPLCASDANKTDSYSDDFWFTVRRLELLAIIAEIKTLQTRSTPIIGFDIKCVNTTPHLGFNSIIAKCMTGRLTVGNKTVVFEDALLCQSHIDMLESVVNEYGSELLELLEEQVAKLCNTHLYEEGMVPFDLNRSALRTALSAIEGEMEYEGKTYHEIHEVCDSYSHLVGLL